MSGHPRSPRRRLRLAAWLAVPAVAAAQFLLGMTLGGAAPAHAATASPGTFSLAVASEVDGSLGRSPSTPIASFRWLISAEKTGGAYGYTPGAKGQAGFDAAGDPANTPATLGQCTPGRRTSAGDPGANVSAGSYDPAACQWPSVRYTPGAVPVVAEGDQGDVAKGLQGIADGTMTTKDAQGNRVPLTLQPGRYLISVLADGYKIDGAHFDIDGSRGNGVTAVGVRMHSYPLPTGTLRLRVFADTAPVDGTYEVGVEKPLAGFTVHLNDVLAEVTNDYFGNKLCTNYVHVTAANLASYPGQKVGDVALDPAAGTPVIDTTNPGGVCLSDASGNVAIPNLGPDRYTATVVAPTGQKWYQTTTLEGNHDWDMWIAEAESGWDTEQTVGNELVPPVDMGFVPYDPVAGQPDSGPAAFPAGGSTVKGTVVEINAYVGGSGGVAIPNAGVAGANVRGPVNSPIVTLSDLDSNDRLVYVHRFGADGKFSIPNVPDGNYQLTLWDYEQDLILDSFNVTVNSATAPQVGGTPTVDLGQKGLVDWYSTVHGRVCVDLNGNGRCDAGEPGVPKFPIGVKERDNSLLDAGQNAATTDEQGNYTVREVYPISKWLVLEAFDTRYKTTGITVQADNEPNETTYKGSAVDVDVQAVIGLNGRVDWAVQPYGGNENGGIVGTVTYDSTRNELDPRYAVTEAYQPGIPGLTVHLYAPVPCDTTSTDPRLSAPPGYATGTASCGTDGYWHNGDGSIVPRSDGNGPVDMSPPYTSETWDQPKDCTARKFDGTPLTDQFALPPFPGVNDPSNASYLCAEAPMLGWYAKPADTTPGAFAQTVNGNYGFATIDHDPATGSLLTNTLGLPTTAPIPNGSDFIVKVDIPKLGNGEPLYQVTKEEDVNIFDGDVRLPQENFPLAPGYTPPPGAQAQVGNQPAASQGAGIWSPCVGANHSVHVTDAAFLAGGGSPYEGRPRSLCDQKLVTVRGGQSVAPNFNLFTPVPLPTHFWGLTINDLGLSQDRTQAGYGEAQPLPNVPMGIYDWSGRLVDTVSTDWNGMYEALEPSTSSYNCPLPAGPCPGMYYFKGNDPGQPGHLNANYNPRFRTIGTEFQAWPGLWTTTDTAPTQVGVIAVAPGSTQLGNVQCGVNDGTGGDPAKLTPDVMAISQPYMAATAYTAAAPVPVTAAAVTGSGSTRTVTLQLASGGNVPAGTTVSVGGLGAPYDVTKVTTVAPVTTVKGLGSPVVSYRVPASANAVAHPAAGKLTTYAAAPNTSQVFTVKGVGFGTAPKVTLTNTTPGAASTAPVEVENPGGGDTQVTFTVTPGPNLPPGTYQVDVTNTGNGHQSVNGITFHVLGTVGDVSYNPALLQVNPPAANAVDSSTATALPGQALNFPSAAYPAVIGGDPNTTPEDVLQKAVDAAAGSSRALVVVWPNRTAVNNPAGEYYENVVVHSPVKLQGVGAGGTYTDAAGQHDVPGTRLDGIGFNPDNVAGANWVAKVASLTTATVPDSAVVTVLGNGGFGSSHRGSLDGMTITGGSQADFATALNEVYGGTRTPVGAPNALVTQGGGIFLHSQANYLQITNNVIVGNSGSYGGGIRIGTPYQAVESTSTPNSWSVPAALQNNNVTVAHNRIRDNGGTNLAGGIGIFDGTNGYTVAQNDLCGNFSAEYGGGLSHYGLSNNGKITHNRFYLNGSYDEGGGIMIAGELNPNLSEPSAGAGNTGRLVIDANLVQDNLANDDGGGIRFLQAGRQRIDVTNNLVDDNVSTHEGGGLALDDSTNVHVTGNTVMNNITTATAVTSNGKPAPAGLSTGANSDQLQATLPQGSRSTPTPLYSQPQDFRNNIFWGNLAGTWDPGTGTVRGVDPKGGSTNPPNEWDLGSVDVLQAHYGTAGTVVAAPLSPAYSVLFHQGESGVANPVPASNQVTATVPGVVSPYPVGVEIISSRTFPSFREAAIVANAVAPNVQGDYHLTAAGAPARGNASLAGLTQAGFPTAFLDYDGQARPLGTGPDIGADEIP